jgi:hypothetical protein
MIDLTGAKLIGSKILVKLTQDNRRTETESGLVNSWNGEMNYDDGLDRFTENVRFANRTGEVMFIPDNTSLKIGDVVWFNFAQMAENPFFRKDGSIYLFVEYLECYAAKRGDDRFAINGNVLLEKVPYLKISDLETLDKSANLDLGIVRYVSSDSSEVIDIKEGDIVYFTDKNAFQDLEYETFACFDGDDVFLVGKREDIGIAL